MSKRVPLDRLSDISRQRSIRRPLLILVPRARSEDRSDIPDSVVEWPIAG